MKIKKNLFSAEIEFEPNELREITLQPTPMLIGLNNWLRDNLKLNLFPKTNNLKKGEE